MVTVSHLFIILAVIIVISSSLSTSSNGKSTVLIIGSTGRVGKSVTKSLESKGYNLRFLVRNLSEDIKKVNCSDGTFIEGDVSNMNALLEASKGCESVITVHGMKPPRFSKLTDFIRHPKLDPSHPYNVNYIGVKNILSAMATNGVSKIVRITGATVGKSPFSPWRVLFSVLLSLSGRWHEASEIAIRESGLDYTILRPTGIENEGSAASQNRSLILVHSDSNEKVKIPSKISVTDLSDLVVLSLTESNLKKCTTICSSSDFPGETSWINLINNKMVPDRKPLKIGPYKLAVSLYLTSIFSLLGLIGKIIFVAIGKLITKFV